MNRWSTDAVFQTGLGGMSVGFTTESSALDLVSLLQRVSEHSSDRVSGAQTSHSSILERALDTDLISWAWRWMSDLSLRAHRVNSSPLSEVICSLRYRGLCVRAQFGIWPPICSPRQGTKQKITYKLATSELLSRCLYSFLCQTQTLLQDARLRP